MICDCSTRYSGANKDTEELLEELRVFSIAIFNDEVYRRIAESLMIFNCSLEDFQYRESQPRIKF